MNDKQGTAHASGTRTAKRTLMRFMACAFCLVLALSGLMACAPKAATDANGESPQASYTPGTYTGVGTGNGGDITVCVSVCETTSMDSMAFSLNVTSTVMSPPLPVPTPV